MQNAAPVAVQETVRIQDDDHATERHERILDAAERCFVRAGFHRTTMQDVASEAGMSPGNLYRYFGSKHAMVAGLVERDRTDLASDFTSLLDAEDVIAAFTELGRKHFEHEPREKAILCLQIWAEAARDPTFGAVTREFERDVVGRMTALLDGAQARGKISATVDPRALAVIVATLADGLFVRRAVMPDFDPTHEVANVMAVIEAALQGRIELTSLPVPTPDQTESH